MPLKVVFDCNVFVQALSRPDGPAGRCVQLVLTGKLALFVSPELMAELREVLSRPKLAQKLRFTSSDAEDFVFHISISATMVKTVPHRWTLTRDPEDSVYVNLAIVAGATVVASRDLDLLDLMNESNPDGQTFRAIAPNLRIVTPPELLFMVDQGS